MIFELCLTQLLPQEVYSSTAQSPLRCGARHPRLGCTGVRRRRSDARRVGRSSSPPEACRGHPRRAGGGGRRPRNRPRNRQARSRNRPLRSKARPADERRKGEGRVVEKRVGAEWLGKGQQ